MFHDLLCAWLDLIVFSNKLCWLFTAAQLGQKVAVLDYVEPSVKGKTQLTEPAAVLL